MELNALTGEIIGSAIEVHRELGGPGLLEDIYESALACELGLRGLEVRRQVRVPVLYKGHKIKRAHFIDLLVDERVVVEVKAVEKHSTLYEAQLLTYLRLTGLNAGLLLNFGQKQLREGVHRVANNLQGKEDLRASASPR